MTIPTQARHIAFQNQSNLCFYCNAPMWEKEATSFLSQFRLTKRQIPLFRCTAEHLIARCDGGTNIRENIVAACWYCNQTRHRFPNAPDPSTYKKIVTKSSRAGKWLTAKILNELKAQQ